jgi:hypothetical protein
MNFVELIITIATWTVTFILLGIWLKDSFVSYREGKISVVMYGDEFFTALIGVRGYEVERWTGRVIKITDTRRSKLRKGMFWGLIPGWFYPAPFFRMKRDIKLVVTEKKHPVNVDASKEKVMFKTDTAVITYREVTTDYILFQNTYFFGFGDLETGNDKLIHNDPTKEQLENLDVQIFIGDKIQITNVRDYLFKEHDWYTPKENLFKSAIREIATTNSYRNLQLTKTESQSLTIGGVKLASYMNRQMAKYDLGNKSIDINIDDIGLGPKSKPYADELNNRVTSSVRIDIAKNEADAIIQRLRGNQAALTAIQTYQLALRQQVDATEAKKWELIQQSKITQFFESNGKPLTEGDSGEVIKLINALISKPAASAA